jgi:hypothetical protein
LFFSTSCEDGRCACWRPATERQSRPADHSFGRNLNAIAAGQRDVVDLDEKTRIYDGLILFVLLTAIVALS